METGKKRWEGPTRDLENTDREVKVSFIPGKVTLFCHGFGEEEGLALK